MCDYSERVARVWPAGLQYTVLFADTHAELNGYDRSQSERYFRAVSRELRFVSTFGRLSDVWAAADLSWNRLEKLMREQQLETERIVTSLDLITAAKRHSLANDPERSARLYCVMRRAENRILAQTYSGYLYATSERRERAALYPEMAVLPLYSWGRGYCVKPWHANWPPSPEK